MASRSKNSIRNIGAGLINKVITLFLPFIVRTVFVQKLGSEYLGLNGLFTSILMLLNLSELGFGSALVFSMYKPLAQNDRVKVGALLNLYKKIYKWIGLGILGAGIFLSPFLPYIIKGEYPLDINIYILFYIFLFNTSISYLLFAYRKALFTADQRNDIISNVSSITTICVNLCQLIVLVVFHNYYLYVLTYPVFTIADNLIVYVLSKKRYSDIVCTGTITDEEKNVIKKHVIGIALQKFCSTSRQSFSNIIISMFLGLSAIAIYSNYFYILTSVHAILYLIPNSIRASVGNSIVSTDENKNFKDFNVMMLIYAWISGWTGVCLLCLYQPFMKLWMGERLMLGMNSVILLCLYFYVLSMSDIISLYKDAAGLWWLGKIRTLSEAICNVILGFLLGWLWGINGILIASLLTLTFIGHGYGGYINFRGYFKSQRFIVYVKDQIVYLVAFLSISAISFLLCDVVKLDGFSGLIIKGIICLVIPNLLYFIAFRYHKYSKSCELFVRGIINSVHH